MYAIDPEIARSAIWEGLSPNPDLNLGGSGLVEDLPDLGLGGLLAEVVEVAVGNGGQSLEALIAENAIHPLEELLRGRPREFFVGRIKLCQQLDILPGVACPKEVLRLFTSIHHGVFFPVLRDTSRNLRP